MDRLERELQVVRGRLDDTAAEADRLREDKERLKEGLAEARDVIARNDDLITFLNRQYNEAILSQQNPFAKYAATAAGGAGGAGAGTGSVAQAAAAAAGLNVARPAMAPVGTGGSALRNTIPGVAAIPKMTAAALGGGEGAVRLAPPDTQSAYSFRPPYESLRATAGGNTGQAPASAARPSAGFPSALPGSLRPSDARVPPAAPGAAPIFSDQRLRFGLLDSDDASSGAGATAGGDGTGRRKKVVYRPRSAQVVGSA